MSLMSLKSIDIMIRFFSVFKKYNKNTFHASFIDCSSVIIANNYGLDYVVSLDSSFRNFEEISLFEVFIFLKFEYPKKIWKSI